MLTMTISSILLNETNVFKLHQKESLLIKKKVKHNSMEMFLAIPWKFSTNDYTVIFFDVLSTINHCKT